MTTHASPIIAALEAAWSALQSDFPSLPDAVITIGSGTTGKHAFHGQWAGERWIKCDHATTDAPMAEITMAGESFERGAVATWGTLAHEAVHAYCHAKGIKETSRQGRYHNRKFKAAAESFGLEITEGHGIGWSVTNVPGMTAKRYADAIAAIDVALTITRTPEHRRAAKAKASTGYVKCICGCPDPNIIRMGRELAEALVVRCDDCDCPFEPADNG